MVMEKRRKNIICVRVVLIFCSVTLPALTSAMEDEYIAKKKQNLRQREIPTFHDMYRDEYRYTNEKLNKFIKQEKEQWEQQNFLKKGWSFLFGHETKIDKEVTRIKKECQKRKDFILDSWENQLESLGVNLSPFAKINEPVYCGLSIDGGGMRGLLPALWLQDIEDNSGKKIVDLFDDFGGTSAGGLISLGLVAGRNGIPNNKASVFVELFKEKGQEIFPKTKFQKNVYAGGYVWSARYSNQPLKKLLGDYFQELRLSNSLKPVLTTAVKIYPSSPSTSYTFESRRALSGESKDVEMSYAALSTAMAPGYFEANDDFVDGGLWQNNPTQLVYNRMRHNYKHDHKNIVMISLGTGKSDLSFPYNLPQNGGLLRVAPGVIQTLMDANSDGVDQEMQMLLGSPYYQRIQGSLESNRSLDDTSLEAIEELERVAEAEYRKLKPITKFLLKNYDLKKDLY